MNRLIKPFSLLDRWTRRCNPLILGGVLAVGAMAAYTGHAMAQEAEAAVEAVTPETCPVNIWCAMPVSE